MPPGTPAVAMWQESEDTDPKMPSLRCICSLRAGPVQQQPRRAAQSPRYGLQLAALHAEPAAPDVQLPAARVGAGHVDVEVTHAGAPGVARGTLDQGGCHTLPAHGFCTSALDSQRATAAGPVVWQCRPPAYGWRWGSGITVQDGGCQQNTQECTLSWPPALRPRPSPRRLPPAYDDSAAAAWGRLQTPPEQTSLVLVHVLRPHSIEGQTSCLAARFNAHCVR